MFWLPVTIAVFIFCVCYSIFIDRLDLDDYACFTFFGSITGFVLTLVISLCLFHSAPSVYIYENDYDLVPIAENVYGMPSKSNSNYIECYTEDENGNLIQLEFNSASANCDVIYTNDYTPHYYSCKKDYESEVLRWLFWKCDCENVTRVTLPLGSIIEIIEIIKKLVTICIEYWINANISPTCITP